MKDLFQADHCARMLKTLADPQRLRIIQSLREGPKTVGELADALSAALVNVSHHLGVLRNVDVVLDEKEGRYVRYRLNPAVYQAKGVEEHLFLGCCRLEIPTG